MYRFVESTRLQVKKMLPALNLPLPTLTESWLPHRKKKKLFPARSARAPEYYAYFKTATEQDEYRLWKTGLWRCSDRKSTPVLVIENKNGTWHTQFGGFVKKVRVFKLRDEDRTTKYYAIGVNEHGASTTSWVVIENPRSNWMIWPVRTRPGQYSMYPAPKDSLSAPMRGGSAFTDTQGMRSLLAGALPRIMQEQDVPDAQIGARFWNLTSNDCS